MNSPLLIPSFNQLTYLRNLINWFHYYYPKNDIFILDNFSSYPPLLEFYSHIQGKNNITVVSFPLNNGAANLRWLINEQILKRYEYFIISDPDIMPHPATPMNFLDIFRYCIDNLGYHHCGFCLKIDDLPGYLEERDMIIKHEAAFWLNTVDVPYEGISHRAYRASIDTTFALYKSNLGWETPMRNDWWENSLRIFEAFHLGWYVNPRNPNDEMDFYFRTAKFKTFGDPDALYNNYHPRKYASLDCSEFAPPGSDE
jgi:hypothetical protein